MNAIDIYEYACDDLESIAELVESAREYVRAATAANTRRAYDADWRDFSQWCLRTGQRALPARPEVVALYLTDNAGKVGTATLARRLAAIRAAHRAADQPVPVGAVLDHVWAGIRRVHGRAPNSKAAVSIEQLSAAVEQLPPTSAGVRDRALLLLGFAGALRRSELVSLEAGRSAKANHVRFVSQGLEIVLQRSKTDQEGAGVVVGVPFGRSLSTCAVQALRSWMKEADIEQGPLFRRIDRWGNISPDRLSDQVVAHVVKAAARRLGLDPRQLSGHSLRAGLATAAAANAAPAHIIMDHMRHAQFDTTKRYIREADRFRSNAAKIAGL